MLYYGQQLFDMTPYWVYSGMNQKGESSYETQHPWYVNGLMVLLPKNIYYMGRRVVRITAPIDRITGQLTPLFTLRLER